MAPVVAIFTLYMAGLLAVALWVERRIRETGRNPAGNPVVYALSLAVYCTSWTYYGSVGYAATSGLSFLAVYIGPTMAFLLGWTLLRKLVRLKSTYRITSIADLVSTRYDRSAGLAALATAGVAIGIMPYIALQLRSIFTSFEIVTSPASGGSWLAGRSAPILVLLITAFTIVVGVRRIDPTERHQGMVMAVAVESGVKLAAFLAAGVFVTFFLFEGFGDLFRRIADTPFSDHITFAGPGGPAYARWTTVAILSMSAILFLPRQFHVAVVENSDERHISTAMWMFPLYMLIINIFVVPIAMGGLLSGIPAAEADSYVLQLPMRFGQPSLALFVFLGGFSAAASMIMVSAMTMSTMITNHLVLPVVQQVRALGFLKRLLLPCRWAAVALVILSGFAFERLLGESYMLVNIGLLSFAATMQFAPLILAGLFWRSANKTGAYLALGAGLSIWFYTLLLPSIVRSGWLAPSLLEEGPMGIVFLRPESLFGLAVLDPLSHGVFWSMFFNIGFLVVGSMLKSQSTEGQQVAEAFVAALGEEDSVPPPYAGEETVDLVAKNRILGDLFTQYFSARRAGMILERCNRACSLADRTRATLTEFAGLVQEAEKNLAGSIGAAAARKALAESRVYSREETESLTRLYSEILAGMNLTPSELVRRVDYHRERESLLQQHARELEEKITQLDREIVDRRRAENLLRDAEEKYRGIFVNAVEGIFQTTEDGRFLSANPALARIFGYDGPDDLIDNVRDIGTELHVQRGEHDRFIELLRREGVVSNREMQLRRKDGRKIWVSTSARAVPGAHGAVASIQGFVEDITERKLAEEDKERMQGQLLQAQKMEAIGTLAGGVAHDFNNLLTAIQGFADLSLLELRDDDPLAENLGRIRDTSERAAALVRQLLLFSRKQPMEMVPLDANGMVEGLLKMLGRIIGEDVGIATRLQPDLWAVRGDATNIEQVIMNLVVNARDAMPAGGTISITTDNRLVDDEYCRAHTEARQGRFVRLVVADTGVGMNPDTVEHIFDPFFSTKEVGSGLGLSVVYGIVSRHEGWLTVDSEPGSGTRFEIFLPATMEVPEEPSHASARRTEPQGAGARILLVEDEEAVRDLARDVLLQNGYVVVEAGSAEEAMEVFRQEDGEFQLLFSDVVLPDTPGVDLAEQLLDLKPELHVLLCSGYTDDKSQWPRIRERGFRFLEKPYSLDSLLRAIERAVAAP